MTIKDQEPRLDLETRFGVLENEIVSQLKVRGGDPDIRIKQGGYEWIRIVSNELEDGMDALILGVDGTWGGKSAMMGYDLGEPPLDRLIEEYASIKDPDFRAIELSFWDRPDDSSNAVSETGEGTSSDIKERLDGLGSHPTLVDFLAAGFRLVKPEDLKLPDFPKPTEEEIAEMDAREEKNEAEKQAYLRANRPRLLEGLVTEMETVLKGLKESQKPDRN